MGAVRDLGVCKHGKRLRLDACDECRREIEQFERQDARCEEQHAEHRPDPRLVLR